MSSKIYCIVFILIVFTPIDAQAEHECDDGYPYGHKIEVKKSLPKNWLIVGDTSISDPRLHSDLRFKYGKYYTSGSDAEGFTIDHFCGFKNGIYVSIWNGDFGPSATFSSEAPKCEKCAPVTENMIYFVSGSGLTLGLSKAKASSILGYAIKDDITSIIFEEIEKDGKHDIWHSQMLNVEFRDDKLIRFSVSDYREQDNSPNDSETHQ